MSVGDVLRYAFLALLFFILLIFGLKWWGKQKTGKQIVTELQSLTSTTSSFGQFYEADAQKSLFLTISYLHRGEKKLGLSPRDLLDKVFNTQKEGGGIFDQSDPSRPRRVDPGEALIRSAILRNYENSKRLGFFSQSLSLEALARGEAPQIQTGPASGKIARIGHIISPEVSPGIEKIIPNLIIAPPEREDHHPTEFEITRAKGLATSLYDASLLEGKARDRIIEHYKNIGTPPTPADEEDGKDGSPP